MSFIFVPVYIQLLGIEAYGLIGLFALLQAWLALLDLGMTPTLSREMAQFVGGARSPQSIRDLLRSIEVVALAIAILIALAIYATSHLLAAHWLQAEGLPLGVVSHALAVMGVVTGLRFIESIYRSSIVGLQQHVLLNAANSAMATLRGIGAVAVLTWVSPTVQAYFIWQGAISLMTLAIFAAVTYNALPSADRGGRFSRTELLSIARFASGMVGIVFLSLLLMQVDKVLLSRLLTLSEYGYYTLAAVAAGTLNSLSGPITQAWYPRLNQLHAAGETSKFIKTYHQGAQLVVVIMGSAAMTLVMFPDVLLLLWTQNAELADGTAQFVSLLAIGNLFNGLMRIPHMTQLVYGWTSLTIWTNIIAVAVVIPAIFWATPRYGAEGAAWVWVALNASYLLISVQFMYRRILTNEKWRWYAEGILQPLAGAFAAALLLRWLIALPTSTIGQASLLAAAATATLFSSLLGAPLLRGSLNHFAMTWLYRRRVKPV